MNANSHKPTQYPAGYVPIVVFDTSAHNRMFKNGMPESELTRIRTMRHIRMTAVCIEELAATRNTTTREALFACSEQILSGSESDCLLPHTELIRTLVLEHYRNPWSFDWTAVDVRSWEYYEEVSARKIVLDDEVANEQREQQMDLQKQFRANLTSLRPKLNSIYEASGEARPLTFREALKNEESRNKNGVISLAKRFYDSIAGTNLNRERIREFLAICPPFRAIVYSNLMPWYDLAVRDLHRGERFQCGRNDLCMAAYLPYCDEFVTDEKKKEHERCLREIATVADISSEVLSFDEFQRRIC